MSSFHSRKRLGQHFLNSKNIVKKITVFARVKNEVVLEIGSGKGMLTRELAKMAEKIYAVELDKRFVARLKKINQPNVVIINDDFLKLDLSTFENPVVVGNIPYSITTHILESLITQKKYLKRAVLTIQREYGDRLCAKVNSNNYGSITLYVNYHYKVKKGFVIPARFFSPRPKVSSTIISLNKRESPFILQDEEDFFKFIQGIFRYRRKSLKNAIRYYLQLIPKDIDEQLFRKRPANLTLNDYYLLYNKIKHERL
jgi:16S rRNA (adenine1518-N6/adenine1519-N6)-dimethyltransferase